MPTTTTAASPPLASVGDQWFDAANGNRRSECTVITTWNAIAGFSGWTATNATSAVSASWLDGSDALTIVASGGGNWLGASPPQPVSPGDVISAVAGVYVPPAGVTLSQVSLSLAWYDGTSTLISSTDGAVASVAAGVTADLAVWDEAPDNAASFTVQAGDAEASPAGAQLVIGNAAATTWAPYQVGTNAIADAAVTPPQVAGNAITAGAVAAGAIDGQVINAVTINGSTITAADVLISGSQGGLFVYSSGGTVVQTLTGSGSWVCPAGVTSVMAECWGGGGGGSGSISGFSGGFAGGGGGEYAAEPSLAVTPGNSYAYTVGTAGTGGSTGGGGGGSQGGDGGNSTFAGSSVTVTAHGGLGSARGIGGTGSTNTVHFTGGAAALGSASAAGGGGGSGGTSSAGNPGAFPAGAAAVTGGGPGGNGGSSGAGSPPSTGPGGGGGGGGGGAGTGGAGFHGKVRLTYTSASPALIGSIAGAAGTADPVAGVAYPEGVASDHVTLTTVTAVPATPTLGCVLYYKSGALWALGPSGTPVSLATT